MEVQNFLNLEIEFIDNLKQGFNTVESIIENTNLSMSSVKMVIEKLQSKGIIEFDKQKRVYQFSKPIDKDNIIILDGNILLPVTVIKKDGFTYISRGNWYKFEGDLDVRNYRDWETDRKSTRLNSSHSAKSRMPSSA